jgi:hypothetical protein
MAFESGAVIGPGDRTVSKVHAETMTTTPSSTFMCLAMFIFLRGEIHHARHLTR